MVMPSGSFTSLIAFGGGDSAVYGSGSPLLTFECGIISTLTISVLVIAQTGYWELFVDWP
jgi:hypothetical protein